MQPGDFLSICWVISDKKKSSKFFLSLYYIQWTIKKNKKIHIYLHNIVIKIIVYLAHIEWPKNDKSERKKSHDKSIAKSNCCNGFYWAYGLLLLDMNYGLLWAPPVWSCLCFVFLSRTAFAIKREMIGDPYLACAPSTAPHVSFFHDFFSFIFLYFLIIFKNFQHTCF